MPTKETIPTTRPTSKPHQALLMIEAAPLDLVLPFWRALRQPRRARPVNEFYAAWGSHLPSERLSELNCA